MLPEKDLQHGCVVIDNGSSQYPCFVPFSFSGSDRMQRSRENQQWPERCWARRVWWGPGRPVQEGSLPPESPQGTKQTFGCGRGGRAHSAGDPGLPVSAGSGAPRGHRHIVVTRRSRRPNKGRKKWLWQLLVGNANGSDDSTVARS